LADWAAGENIYFIHHNTKHKSIFHSPLWVDAAHFEFESKAKIRSKGRAALRAHLTQLAVAKWGTEMVRTEDKTLPATRL